MTTLGDRIDEFMLRKLEVLIHENREMRRILETALDVNDSTGIPKYLDGKLVRCVKHDAMWFEEVRKVLGKDAPHVVRQ